MADWIQVHEMSAGERITFLRKELGITQSRLAEMIDVRPSTLSRYENDLYDARGGVLCAMAQALHTSVDFLLCLSDVYTLPQNGTGAAAVASTLSVQEKQLINIFRELPKDVDRVRVLERAETLRDLHKR